MEIVDLQNMAFRHYFRARPFSCKFVSGDLENFFTVAVQEKINNENILKGDPIVYGWINDKSDVETKGGLVLRVNPDDRTILIAPDKEFKGAEKRQDERFATSLFGYIKYGEKREQSEFAYIKDMSYSGLRFYTKAEMNVGEYSELGVSFHDKVLNLEILTVRRGVSFGRNEYGVQIVYRSTSMVPGIKDYMKSIIRDEKDMLFKVAYK